MNAKIFAHAAIALLLVGCFYSCKNGNEDDFSEPREIPFTEVLVFDSCHILSSGWNPSVNTVKIINSNEEFENYCSCLESYYPAVDFRKQTLLLATGVEASLCALIDQRLHQTSPTDYILDLYFRTYYTPSKYETWRVGIIVDKLSVGSNFEVNVNYDWYQPDYDPAFEPVEIPTTEYITYLLPCFTRGMRTCNHVIVINNNEDLGKYSNCTGDEPLYPPVDFFKHTLLLAFGTGYGVPIFMLSYVSVLKHVGPEKYILSVKTPGGPWQAAILVPKLSNMATIELEVQMTHF